MLPLKDDVPSRSFPWVNVVLIFTNSAVFLWEVVLGSEATGLIMSYGVVPHDLLTSGLQRVHTLLTSMFLHGGWAHIVGNMLYLWIFGDNVEDCLGRVRYLFFYLLCGLIASLAHIATSTGSLVPTIGASGAISGVLGGYILLYPRAGVWTFVFFGFFIRMLKVPAFFLLGFWILVQLVSGAASLSQADGGIAWFAHIGGFFAGLALVKLFQKRPPVRSYGRW
jgi:membrane associated rhomboid family serine protease